MDNRAATGWGEQDIELEVPLGLDHVTYKKHRKPQPKPNYTRIQALLLLGMIVIVAIAGVII